ncbi:LuxR C-terminal-related transcriptional regulator [Streptomyces sp. NPDC048518]|uniref:LuxR C-terminal-related transcriptional regulator n=1 Tax=Streptomyces sp. NPDC048518 TaxID=3155029 RepID=UPI00340EA104
MSEASRLAVYMELRERGGSDPEELTDSFGLSRSEARATWASLRRLGLVSWPAEPGDRVVPVDPEFALMRMLRQQQDMAQRSLEESLRMHEAMESLLEVYLPATGSSHSRVEVTAAGTIDEMVQALHDVTDSARATLRTAYAESSLPARLRRRIGPLRQQMFDRGIQVRSVRLRRDSMSPGTYDSFGRLVAAGVDLRLASVIPLNMVIIDSDYAVLPAADDASHSCQLTIRGAPLVSAFSAVFEHTWREATPFAPEGERSPTHLSTEQRTLVQLLADGMKDEAIARTLGVSPRTASRLIADLMQRLGVTSRFAAGARAAQYGLLTPARPPHITPPPVPAPAPAAAPAPAPSAP